MGKPRDRREMRIGETDAVRALRPRLTESIHRLAQPAAECDRDDDIGALHAPDAMHDLSRPRAGDRRQIDDGKVVVQERHQHAGQVAAKEHDPPRLVQAFRQRLDA